MYVAKLANIKILHDYLYSKLQNLKLYCDKFTHTCFLARNTAVVSLRSIHAKGYMHALHNYLLPGKYSYILATW